MHQLRNVRYRAGTHGNDNTLYNIPILIPISLISEICATHGFMSEMKAPDKKPKIVEKTMITAKLWANIQMKRQDSPARRAEGYRRLKRPTASESMAGIIRPKTPPAFIAERT